jgi:Flp pilus assembly protein TadD
VLLGLTSAYPALCRTNNDWAGISTPQFVLVTTDRQERGREFLERLEVARQFFEKTGWAKRNSDQRVTILAFNSDKEYYAYHFNPSAYAFYQLTPRGDYVVMRDLAREHFSVAIHEYTHAVVEHSGLNLPLWLNEGLADFYSTIESRRTKVLLGAPPPGREEILRSRRWMDWATLTSVDQNSPYYQQPEKMLLFYSQSWALVHMLALDPAYADGFPRLIKAVSDGASPDAALLAVYRKTLEQVGGELIAYASANRLRAHLLDVDARPTAFEEQALAEPGKHAGFALAEVLSAHPETASTAKALLAQLNAKYPGDPRSEESLGDLAMRAGSEQEAALHLSRAVNSNTQNPEALFRLAFLKIQRDGPSAEATDLLQRVLALDDTNYNALLELGCVDAKLGKYELAVHILERIVQPKAENAYQVSYTLAYCFMELREGQRARAYAQQATQMAASAKDQAAVAGLARYIDQQLPLEMASRARVEIR